MTKEELNDLSMTKGTSIVQGDETPIITGMNIGTILQQVFNNILATKTCPETKTKQNQQEFKNIFFKRRKNETKEKAIICTKDFKMTSYPVKYSLLKSVVLTVNAIWTYNVTYHI